MAIYSLRVDFDAPSNVLRFFVPEREEPLGTWDLSMRVPSASELEGSIGYIVLSALSRSSGQSIAGRDYDAERNKATPAVLKHLMSRLEAGDESVLQVIVHELVGAAYRNADVGELERADQVLREAASKGNRYALEYLAGGWARDKNDAAKSIEQGSAPRTP